MNDSGIGKANNIKFNNHVYNWQFLSSPICVVCLAFHCKYPKITQHKKELHYFDNNCIFYFGGKTMTIKNKNKQQKKLLLLKLSISRARVCGLIFSFFLCCVRSLLLNFMNYSYIFAGFFITVYF